MKSASRWLQTGALLTALALAGASYAQMGQGMMGSRGAQGPGSEQATGMMRDMSKEMTEMSDAMAKGTLTPEMQKRMSQQMKEMAGMMDGISGMMGPGMMTSPDSQKRMDQMRMRMDEMMKQPAGAPLKN